MSRSFRQLLSLFVMLALVFSPLQSAFAGAAFSMSSAGHEMVMADDDAGKAAPSGPAMSHDMMQMDAMADHECDQCKADSCCIGGQCLSGHCATCAMGLIPVAFSSPAELWHAIAVAPDAVRLQRLSDSLFRPPRV